MTTDVQTAVIGFADGSSIQAVSLTVKLDETWAPYVQGNIVVPSTAAAKAIDPRTRDRVTVTLTEAWSPYLTTAAITADYPAGLTTAKLTTDWGGKLTSALSAKYQRLWPGGDQRNPVTRTMDLLVNEATSTPDGLTALTVSSDEQLIIDHPSLGTESGTVNWTPQLVTGSPNTDPYTMSEFIRAIVNTLIAGMNFPQPNVAALGMGSAVQNPGGGAGRGVVIPMGTNPWDSIQSWAQVAGWRVWCDEKRAWHIAAAPTVTPGRPTFVVAAGVNLVDYSDTKSREGDFYDAVAVQYSDGLDPVPGSDDIIVNPNRSRSLIVSYDTPKPPVDTWPDDTVAGPGYKIHPYKTILDRVSKLGRTLPVTVLQDISVDVGDPYTVQIEVGGPVLTGRIGSVSFDFGDTYEMELVARTLA